MVYFFIINGDFVRAYAKHVRGTWLCTRTRLDRDVRIYEQKSLNTNKIIGHFFFTSVYIHVYVVYHTLMVNDERPDLCLFNVEPTKMLP